jgi:phage-related minor tail protein
LISSQLKTDISFAQVAALINQQHQDKLLERDWQIATKKAAAIAKKNGLSLASFATWTGTDLSLDFYRLWSADQLALKDIDQRRFAHYQLLAQQFMLSDSTQKNAANPTNKPRNLYQEKLGKLMKILVQFSGDAPSDHFLLELDSGKITSLQ